jgi:LmbE family N-acetylglucosaminyl deacetylase
MKLSILAFGAHPDDVELSAAGTLLKHQAAGATIGIIDLTEGELGSRGTVDTRYAEAKAAGEILQLSVRENLQMGDGFFTHSEENLLKIVQQIRRFQPTICKRSFG